VQHGGYQAIDFWQAAIEQRKISCAHQSDHSPSQRRPLIVPRRNLGYRRKSSTPAWPMSTAGLGHLPTVPLCREEEGRHERPGQAATEHRQPVSAPGHG
jgi:hypothetical protein